jgi:CelD/BcsL family acetyltransferase involved in cellulose biosynthesis
MSWRLTPIGQFAELADQWGRLNDATAQSPLLATQFVAPLIKEFSTGNELIATFERDGQIVAMGIFASRRRGVWETFQPSQAPIGMWLHRPGLDLEPLLGELARRLPGLVLVLGLTQRDPLIDARPADTRCLRTVDYVNTAKILIQGSFESYWSERGKNLRSNLRKQRNKLEKEGIAVRLEISGAKDDMALAIADYGRLESAGWKARNGTAIHPDNNQGRFYQSMLERFAEHGAARVYRYWFNDKVVSMNLCIEGNGSLIVLKTTYDENMTAHYSPSFLMREETCQKMFEEKKFDRLEFYGKVMEWHVRWTDESRTMYHVNYYRWPALIALMGAIKQGIAALRARRTSDRPASGNAPDTPITE